MSPTNLLTIVVLVVAVVVILVLRKRGEQRQPGAGSSTRPAPTGDIPKSSTHFTLTGGITTTQDAPAHSHEPGVHAHIDTAIHTSTRVVERLQGEDKLVLDRWMGAGGGEWTAEQKARFAAGFQRFLWDGEGLPTILAGISKILRFKYPTIAGTPLDVDVPQDVRAVFAKLTGGSITRA